MLRLLEKGLFERHGYDNDFFFCLVASALLADIDLLRESGNYTIPHMQM